jgi:hypothetical protein
VHCNRKLRLGRRMCFANIRAGSDDVTPISGGFMAKIEGAIRSAGEGVESFGVLAFEEIRLGSYLHQRGSQQDQANRADDIPTLGREQWHRRDLSNAGRFRMERHRSLAATSAPITVSGGSDRSVLLRYHKPTEAPAWHCGRKSAGSLCPGPGAGSVYPQLGQMSRVGPLPALRDPCR